MAKKKSKWIKANADTARELEAARDRRDRDARTGGSLRGAADGSLFAIDKVKGGSRLLFKKDGLLTSVRMTMPGPHIKPFKTARPLRGQVAKPTPKVRQATGGRADVEPSRGPPPRAALTRQIPHLPLPCPLARAPPTELARARAQARAQAAGAAGVRL